MKHVVMYSGGAGSYGAAQRVIGKHGAADTTLLFTDTLIEDGDLYRFLSESAEHLGATLVVLMDGRTPWQVFKDRKMLGSSRIANCSIELKQMPARRWVAENCDQGDTTLYVGIDWSEEHRLAGAQKGWAPWRVEAPLCEPPLIDKWAILADLKAVGIEPPRLYRLGFPHNNCGGGCVRAGQAHFTHLLKTLPDVYADWERNEEDVRRFLGKDVSILRSRVGGASTPLTLAEHRRIYETTPQQLDLLEWGGCGCFLEDES